MMITPALMLSCMIFRLCNMPPVLPMLCSLMALFESETCPLSTSLNLNTVGAAMELPILNPSLSYASLHAFNPSLAHLPTPQRPWLLPLLYASPRFYPRINLLTPSPLITIATVSAAITPLSNKRAAQRMHIITDGICSSGPITLNWTRGHPERRQPDSATGDYYDWDIHIADIDAGADSAALQRLNATASLTLTHSMTLLQALQSVIPSATWHWTDSISLNPTLGSLQRVCTYLLTRDEIWRDPDLPPRWVGPP